MRRVLHSRASLPTCAWCFFACAKFPHVACASLDTQPEEMQCEVRRRGHSQAGKAEPAQYSGENKSAQRNLYICKSITNALSLRILQTGAPAGAGTLPKARPSAFTNPQKSATGVAALLGALRPHSHAQISFWPPELACVRADLRCESPSRCVRSPDDGNEIREKRGEEGLLERACIQASDGENITPRRGLLCYYAAE